MATQLITPNPNVPCRPGMCLEYVRKTFDLPIRYGSATEAWNNSPSQHPDRNFPAGVAVPIWFAIDIEPNGHVALLMPDLTVYSSSDLGNIPHHHSSIEDLITYYAYWGKMQLTLLGWSEDVAGYPVVSMDGSISVDSITPTPAAEQDVFDIMTATPEEQDAFIERLLNHQVTQPDGNKNSLGALLQEERGHYLSLLGHMDDRASAVVNAIFNTPIPNATGGNTTLGALIGWNDSHVNSIIDAAKSGGAPLDTAAVQKAVSAALVSGVRVNITTN